MQKAFPVTSAPHTMPRSAPRVGLGVEPESDVPYTHAMSDSYVATQWCAYHRELRERTVQGMCRTYVCAVVEK